MHAAIDIGVLARLIAHQPVDHWLRHLARRRVIEIDQRLAVDLELENRKIGADAFNVEHRSRIPVSKQSR